MGFDGDSAPGPPFDLGSVTEGRIEQNRGCPCLDHHRLAYEQNYRDRDGRGRDRGHGYGYDGNGGKLRPGAVQHAAVQPVPGVLLEIVRRDYLCGRP